MSFFPLPQQDGHDRVRVAFRSWTFSNNPASARERLRAGFVQSLCKICIEKRKLVTPRGGKRGLLSLKNGDMQIYFVSCSVLTLTAHLSPCYHGILWLRVSFSLSACWVSFSHLLTFRLQTCSTNTKCPQCVYFHSDLLSAYFYYYIMLLSHCQRL